jgi:outer membrane protein assembly factor BamE
MRAYYDVDSCAELAESAAQRHGTNPATGRPSFFMKKFTALVLLIATLASSGCVYRLNISQGNLIKQEDLDQVEMGMTRNQVRYLLGTPLIDDPFHADRWDYVYYQKIGRDEAGFKRWVSIEFSEDKVSDIRKDQDLSPDL